MPTALITKVAKECGLKVSEIEAKWDEAKAQAEKQGKGDNYAYITQIFKSILGDKCCRKLGYCKGTTVMANKVRIPVSALAKLSAKDTGLGYGDDTIKEDKTKDKNVKSSERVAKGKRSTAKKSLSDIDEDTFKQKMRQGG